MIAYFQVNIIVVMNKNFLSCLSPKLVLEFCISGKQISIIEKMIYSIGINNDSGDWVLRVRSDKS